MSQALTTNSNLRLILGPPGTGKTTTLLRCLDEEFQGHGTPPDRIAVATFTRSAKLEVLSRAADKFNLGEQDLPWVKTIHSIGFRLLGLNKDRIVNRSRWRQFSQGNGYTLSDEPGDAEDPSTPSRITAHDELRAAYFWCRSRRLDPLTGIAKYPGTPPRQEYERFVRRFAGFKRELGLLDFADMVEHALPLRPSVTVAIIDEAQDLSPLQIAAVESWFGGCQRVYVAGDDDQAIYGFQGADPGWLVGMSRARPEATTVLSQSFRVPATVHSLSQKIISGNEFRVAKEYRPMSESGAIHAAPLAHALDLACSLSGSVKVLARNWRFLADARKQLMATGTPFIIDRGACLLKRDGLHRALFAGVALLNGESVHSSDLLELLDFFPTTGGPVLLPRIKARLERTTARLTPNELASGAWRLGAYLDFIRRHGVIEALIKGVDPIERAYLSAIVGRFGEVPRKPRVHLTSIHQSKGSEADTVVLLDELTRAPYEEFTGSTEGWESENRVAYVGTTRARKRLIIATSTSQMTYPYTRLGRGLVSPAPSLEVLESEAA